MCSFTNFSLASGFSYNSTQWWHWDIVTKLAALQSSKLTSKPVISRGNSITSTQVCSRSILWPLIDYNVVTVSNPSLEPDFSVFVPPRPQTRLKLPKLTRTNQTRKNHSQCVLNPQRAMMTHKEKHKRRHKTRKTNFTTHRPPNKPNQTRTCVSYELLRFARRCAQRWRALRHCARSPASHMMKMTTKHK